MQDAGFLAAVKAIKQVHTNKYKKPEWNAGIHGRHAGG